MNVFSMKTAALLAVAGAIPLVQDAVLQDTEVQATEPQAAAVPAAAAKSTDAGLFKAPVRLKAGDKFLGEKRLYPSPVVHDLDGDGMPDIVIGDLIGKVTVATRISTEGVLALEKEKAVQNRDGQPLKFHNW